jgi:hypothetical protein
LIGHENKEKCLDSRMELDEKKKKPMETAKALEGFFE